MLVSFAVRDLSSDERRAAFEPWTPTNVAALVIIALMSLRTEGLFEVLGERGAIHHWGAWVGAADLVREGGWLLWDAPSNYGSLNVLAFAVIPTATPWQSFYLVQALAFFIVSASLFLLLRALRPGVLNWLFALATAIAVPMFTPTYDAAAPVTATFVFPNWGAYRYVCVVIILAILIWEQMTKEQTSQHAVVLATGCFTWVIGVLWSPESALFCSGAWLPAYLAIVLRMTAVGSGRWRRALSWLALPGVLLAATLGIVIVAFIAALGHLPDWESYLDYAREVGLNVLIVVQEPVGPAMGLLLGFCVLAIGAFYAGFRDGLKTREFALWIGLLGAFWATNSYGYQRGLVSLHPAAYATLGILLLLAAREPQSRPWNGFARAGTVPLLVMPLISSFAAVAADPLAIRDAAAALATTMQHRFEVEHFLPDADPDLQALMAEARVLPSDPIFYAGEWLGNYLLPWRPGPVAESERVVVGRHWTPGHPSLALRWIPKGRGAIYTARFIERTRESGWLIQSKTGVRASVDSNGYSGGLEPWFFDMVSQTHVPTRIFENGSWQLVWFAYVGDDPTVTRPDYPKSRLGPLPPDIFVDGKALAGTAHPEVWTIFGEGWRFFDVEKRDRRAESRADLWIYSSDMRDTQVRLTPAKGINDGLLQVLVNGEPVPPPLQLVSGQPAETSLTLESGWNRVTFSVVPADAPLAPGSEATTEPEQSQRNVTSKKRSRDANKSGVARSAESGANETTAESISGFVLERIDIITEATGIG